MGYYKNIQSLLESLEIEPGHFSGDLIDLNPVQNESKERKELTRKFRLEIYELQEDRFNTERILAEMRTRRVRLIVAINYFSELVKNHPRFEDFINDFTRMLPSKLLDPPGGMIAICETVRNYQALASHFPAGTVFLRKKLMDDGNFYLLIQKT